MNECKPLFTGDYSAAAAAAAGEETKWDPAKLRQGLTLVPISAQLQLTLPLSAQLKLTLTPTQTK